MRKSLYRSVAVITFLAGVGAYFYWTRTNSPNSPHNVSESTSNIWALRSAKLVTPLVSSDGKSISENPFMVLRSQHLPRSVSEPIQAATPQVSEIEANCGALYISAGEDRKVNLNMREMGTIDNLDELSSQLGSIFQERIVARAYDRGMENRPELPATKRIYKTVIIRASRSLRLDDCLKLVDVAEKAGAEPSALQLSELPQ